MKVRSLLTGLAAITFVSARSEAAQVLDKREVAKCAAIDDSVRRLECFDHFASRIGVSTLAHKSKSAGHWKVETSVSKIDDSKTVTLSVDADSPIHGWPGTSVRPSLILRCQEKKIEGFIITGMSPNVEYGRTDSATVTLRLDKDKAFDLAMSESTDKETLFFHDAKHTILQMKGRDSLLFQFVPFNSSPVNTTFKLTGLDVAIKPLAEACDWDQKPGIDFETLAIRTPIQLNLHGGRVVKGEFASYSDSLGKYYIYTKEPNGNEAMQNYSRDELEAIVVRDTVVWP